MSKMQNIVQKVQEQQCLPIRTHKEDQYIVEAIRAKKVTKGEVKYLIKWAGYKQSQNTWQPLINLQGIHQMIIKFEEQQKQAKNKSHKKIGKVKINEEQQQNSLTKNKANQNNISKQDKSAFIRQNKIKSAQLQEQLNIKLKKKKKIQSNNDVKDQKQNKATNKLQDKLEKKVSQKKQQKPFSRIHEDLSSPKQQNLSVLKIKQEEQKKRKKQDEQKKIIQQQDRTKKQIEQSIKKLQEEQKKKKKQDEQKKKKKQDDQKKKKKQDEQKLKKKQQEKFRKQLKKMIQEPTIIKANQQQHFKQTQQNKVNIIDQKLKSIDNIFFQSKKKKQSQYEQQTSTVGTNTQYKMFPGAISYRVNNIHKRQVKTFDGSFLEKIFVEIQLMNYKDQWLRSPQIVPIQQIYDMSPIILIRYFENLYKDLYQDE